MNEQMNEWKLRSLGNELRTVPFELPRWLSSLHWKEKLDRVDLM